VGGLNPTEPKADQLVPWPTTRLGRDLGLAGSVVQSGTSERRGRIPPPKHRSVAVTQKPAWLIRCLRGSMACARSVRDSAWWGWGLGSAVRSVDVVT